MFLQDHIDQRISVHKVQKGFSVLICQLIFKVSVPSPCKVAMQKLAEENKENLKHTSCFSILYNWNSWQLRCWACLWAGRRWRRSARRPGSRRRRCRWRGTNGPPPDSGSPPAAPCSEHKHCSGEATREDDFPRCGFYVHCLASDLSPPPPTPDNNILPPLTMCRY